MGLLGNTQAVGQGGRNYIWLFPGGAYNEMASIPTAGVGSADNAVGIGLGNGAVPPSACMPWAPFPPGTSFALADKLGISISGATAATPPAPTSIFTTLPVGGRLQITVFVHCGGVAQDNPLLLPPNSPQMIATITNLDTANCFCLPTPPAGTDLTYQNAVGQLDWSCNDLSSVYVPGLVPTIVSPPPGPTAFPTPTLANAISVMVHLGPTNPASDWDMTAWELFGGLILSVDVPVEIKYP